MPVEPSPQHFPNRCFRYWAATRPAFLSVTLVGCLLGMATASADGLTIRALPALLTLLFAALAHAGGNVLNDYYDALNGSDAQNTERVFPFTGGSRFIQNGLLTVQETARFGFALMLLVVPAGLWLALDSGPGLLLIGVAGLCTGWAYSAPPIQLMSRGLGEIGIVLAWLLIVVGSDYVQRAAFDLAPLLTGLPFALLVANILFINQFPDHRADASTGKRTLVVRLGPQTARWGGLVLSLSALASLLGATLAGALPPLTLLSALALLPAFNAARQLLRHASQPRELTPAIQQTILSANVHGILLAALMYFFPAG